MFSPTFLFSIIFAYLVLLFLIAHYAEKMDRKGSRLVSNPYVYSLSLAVYCTSWTFYGSVGKAANAGLSFLTIYIGPTLMAALWWLVLRKIIYICKENRITTISDFIASRYGNSLFLSALITFVAVIGITPYLGLQLKAIMHNLPPRMDQEVFTGAEVRECSQGPQTRRREQPFQAESHICSLGID